jgi:hypothetical protein
VIASATAAGAVSLEWTPPTDPGTASVTTYTVSASTGPNCVDYYNPVISGDGSTLAVATLWNTEIENQAGYSLATITTRIGSGVNTSVAAPSTTFQLYPVALDNNGGVLIAASYNYVNASLGGPQSRLSWITSRALPCPSPPH